MIHFVGEADEKTFIDTDACSPNVSCAISLISQKQAKLCVRLPTSQRALQTLPFTFGVRDDDFLLRRQGDLAHNKTPPPLVQPYGPRHRASVGS